MANPGYLTATTVLYCAAEPEGRLFPAGETWPGDAWSTIAGGEPVGKGATAQAMKDLLAAEERHDAMSAQIEGMTHSLAQRSAERDEAVGKVADLEQRAISAEQAQKASAEAAAGYMVERDAARADAKRFSDQVDALRPEAERVPDLLGKLEAANQASADLSTQVAALTEQLAAKPKKPTKEVDAAPPVAADAQNTAAAA